jgi:hypothetical protein
MVDGAVRFFIWLGITVFNFVVAAAKLLLMGLWYVTGVTKQRPLFIWLCLFILAEIIGGYAEKFFEFQILGEPVVLYGCIITFLFGLGHLAFEIVNWFRSR